jgi:hypothetical protein
MKKFPHLVLLLLSFTQCKKEQSYYVGNYKEVVATTHGHTPKSKPTINLIIQAGQSNETGANENDVMPYPYKMEMTNALVFFKGRVDYPVVLKFLCPMNCQK